MLDGMHAAEAEVEAVRQMGDPVEVGQALDGVHRPDAQWAVLIVFAVLAAIGAGAQAYCGVVADMWWIGTWKTVGAFLVGILVMSALHFADCQGFLARHALLLTGVVVGSACFVSLACDATNTMSRVAYSFHNVTLAFPLLFALFLYRCRSLGWTGFGACLLAGSVMAALAAYFGGTPQLLSTAVSVVVLMSYASAVGWLGISRLRSLAAIIVGAIGVFLLFLTAGVLERCCGWYPLSEFSAQLSVATSDYALVAMSSTLGFAPLMLLCSSVLAMSAWIAARSSLQGNRLSAMTGMAVALTIACSALTAMTPFVLGIVFPGNAFPFLTPGFHSTVLIAEAGIALSGLRYRRRPSSEASKSRPTGRRRSLA